MAAAVSVWNPLKLLRFRRLAIAVLRREGSQARRRCIGGRSEA